MTIFAPQAVLSLLFGILKGGGKSGQHRASHFLTGRICRNTKTASATENYSRAAMRGDGENVR